MSNILGEASAGAKTTLRLSRIGFPERTCGKGMNEGQRRLYVEARRASVAEPFVPVSEFTSLSDLETRPGSKVAFHTKDVVTAYDLEHEDWELI